MLLQEIKNSLQSISEFNIEEIIDVSQSHRGHQSVKNLKDQLTHIEIIVSFFEKNISRIEVPRGAGRGVGVRGRASRRGGQYGCGFAKVFIK